MLAMELVRAKTAAASDSRVNGVDVEGRTRAEVVVDGDRKGAAAVVVSGGRVWGGGGRVVVGGGPDIDTRLIGLRILPGRLRRL